MYTKGPWGISKAQKGSQGTKSFRIFSDNPKNNFKFSVAKVYLGDIESTDTAEGEANALLISQAPELLSVLEQIAAMTYVTEIKGKKVEINPGLIFNIASRAIAKAKGEV